MVCNNAKILYKLNDLLNQVLQHVFHIGFSCFRTRVRNIFVSNIAVYLIIETYL